MCEIVQAWVSAVKADTVSAAWITPEQKEDNCAMKSSLRFARNKYLRRSLFLRVFISGKCHGKDRPDMTV